MNGYTVSSSDWVYAQANDSNLGAGRKGQRLTANY